MARLRRPGLYVVLCRDGEAHMGEEPRLKLEEAERAKRVVDGTACGPHRVVLYRPAGKPAGRRR